MPLESERQFFTQEQGPEVPPAGMKEALEYVQEIQRIRQKEILTKEDEEIVRKLVKKIETIFEVEPIVSTLKEALEKGADPNDVAWGLAGVGTQEAMELRKRLLEEGADKDYVAWGLAGVGTQEAMELRKRLLEEGANKDYVAWGLAGVGTQEAMKLRKRLLEEGANKVFVAEGLAGVNTKEAQEFRKKYFGDDPRLLAKSYSTGCAFLNGVICRYGYEKEE